MSTLDDLLKQIPVAEIAAKLGVDEATATAAVQQAVPALVGGLTHNAQTGEGAAKLENALHKHEGAATGGLSLEAVDEADGEKIVGHVFGDKKDDVVAALGAQSGAAGLVGGLLPKVLPLLAPMVMSFVASKLFGQKNESAEAAPAEGGGLGDMLGGLLGGGSNNNEGGGLGDMLGGLLGGGGGQQSGGGIGDLLGGLFGGKK